MYTVRVFMFGSTVHRDVEFDTARLEFSDGARWSEACWAFEAAGSPVRLRCPQVSEIASLDGAPFPLEVQAPDGRRGPYTLTGVLVGEPLGAHCLLYAARWDGVLSGQAVATHAGQVVVSPFDYDAS